MLESLFNNATDLEACNLIEKRLQHRCFRVNIAKFKKICYVMTLIKTNYFLHYFAEFSMQFSVLFKATDYYYLYQLKYRNKFTV